MRRVWSACNTFLAGHAQRLLEQAGIECFLRNALLSGAAGELPPTECWPEVWIRNDRDFDTAVRILDESIGDRARRGKAWRCTCGEQIEGQFTACWRCGAERQDTDWIL